MTTGPIDLDDSQLDAVTGGGNPLAGGAKITAFPGMSPLKDLAAAIDQQTGSSVIANAAKELASGQQGAPTGKTPAVPGNAVTQLADAVNAIHALDPRVGSAASDQQKAMIASLLKQVGAVDGAAGKAMTDAIQKMLSNGDGTKADPSIKKPIGSTGPSTGHLGDSMGGYVNPVGQSQAKQGEADAKIDAATAQLATQQADVQKGSQAALNDMMKQIINFLNDLKDAKAEQMRIMTRV